MPWSLDICSSQLLLIRRVGTHILIETPICTRRTTTHQLIWRQPQKCCALVRSQWNAEWLKITTRLRTFIPDIGTHPHGMTLPRTAWVRLNRLRTIPAYTNGAWSFCRLLVWRRGTDRGPCCPSLSNPSNSLWSAWPNGSGWRNNWLCAQHPPRDLVRSSSGLKELAQTMKITNNRFRLVFRRIVIILFYNLNSIPLKTKKETRRRHFWPVVDAIFLWQAHSTQEKLMVNFFLVVMNLIAFDPKTCTAAFSHWSASLDIFEALICCKHLNLHNDLP